MAEDCTWQALDCATHRADLHGETFNYQVCAKICYITLFMPLIDYLLLY